MSKRTIVKGVEILRTGEFIDMDGQTVRIDEPYLEAVDRSYDPSFHEAQITFDHERSGPSAGRILDLYKSADRLLADFDVGEELAGDVVEGGRWPNRSAELYGDLEGRGPYLRAVSILGARPPSVKGLRKVSPSQLFPAVAFGECEGGKTCTFTYNLMSEEDSDMGEAEFKALSEQVANLTGQIAQLSETAAKLPVVEAELAKTKEEAATLLAEKTEREQIIKLGEARGKAQTKMAELRTAHKVTPGMEDAGMEDLIALAEYSNATVKMGNQTYSLSELLNKLFAAIPDVLPETGTVKTTEENPVDAAFAELTEEEKTVAKKMFPDPAECKAHLTRLAERKAAKGKQ